MELPNDPSEIGSEDSLGVDSAHGQSEKQAGTLAAPEPTSELAQDALTSSSAPHSNEEIGSNQSSTDITSSNTNAHASAAPEPLVEGQVLDSESASRMLPLPSSKPGDGLLQQKRKEIRIGNDYQATVPEILAPSQRAKAQGDCESQAAVRVWDPAACPLSQQQLQSFLLQANKLRLRHTTDQVLGVLYWNNFDVSASIKDLQLFRPHPDLVTEWSETEMELFAKLYTRHGKRFHKIAEKFPDKSTSNIVNYYYRYKTSRAFDAELQALIRASHLPEQSHDGAHVSAVKETKTRQGRPPSVKPTRCVNCLVRLEKPAPISTAILTGPLCLQCRSHFEKWGTDRPNPENPVSKRAKLAQKLSTGADLEEAVADTGLERLSSLRRDVTALVEELSKLGAEQAALCVQNQELETETNQVIRKRDVERWTASARSRRSTDTARSSTSPRASQSSAKIRSPAKGRRGRESIWSPQEIELLLPLFEVYGTAFEKIAAGLNSQTGSNKTWKQVRSFYNNYGRKLNIKPARRKRKAVASPSAPATPAAIDSMNSSMSHGNYPDQTDELVSQVSQDADQPPEARQAFVHEQATDADAGLSVSRPTGSSVNKQLAATMQVDGTAFDMLT